MRDTEVAFEKKDRGFLASEGLRSFEWSVVKEKWTNKDGKEGFFNDALFAVSDGSRSLEFFGMCAKELDQQLVMATTLRAALDDFINAVEELKMLKGDDDNDSNSPC